MFTGNYSGSRMRVLYRNLLFILYLYYISKSVIITHGFQRYRFQNVC